MAGLMRRTLLSLGFTTESGEYGDHAADHDRDHLETDHVPVRPRRQHIATLHARQFNSDAPVIGDLFRSGTTVIMDLTGADESTLTRFVDFGAGLAFGHGGRIERVAPAVFLLSQEGAAA